MKKGIIPSIVLILLAACAPLAAPSPTKNEPVNLSTPSQTDTPSGTALPSVTPALTEPDPTKVSDIAFDGCKIYRNVELGYRFHYPADAVIEYSDEPLYGIIISGPVVNGESWPVFGIAHPRDRQEYRPPKDVDLLQWLTDHYLLGDERLPDVQIAGTSAVHLHHDRSPQSYASERYYFINAGQLYVFNILHTGDRENWDLYNHFLGSFQFDRAISENSS